jgi:hypothetical protein
MTVAKVNPVLYLSITREGLPKIMNTVRIHVMEAVNKHKGWTS